MRTTLEVDDDLIDSAKNLAKSEDSTVGQVISDLVRLALHQRNMKPGIRNGVPLFTPVAADRRPDLALVNALRDEE